MMLKEGIYLNDNFKLLFMVFIFHFSKMVFTAVDRYITVSGVSWLGWYMKRKLEEATKDVNKAQHETLIERINENKDTEYGKRFMFDQIKDRHDFVKFHPLTR